MIAGGGGGGRYDGPRTARRQPGGNWKADHRRDDRQRVMCRILLSPSGPSRPRDLPRRTPLPGDGIRNRERSRTAHHAFSAPANSTLTVEDRHLDEVHANDGAWTNTRLTIPANVHLVLRISNEFWIEAATTSARRSAASTRRRTNDRHPVWYSDHGFRRTSSRVVMPAQAGISFDAADWIARFRGR